MQVVIIWIATLTVGAVARRYLAVADCIDFSFVRL